MDDVPTVPGVSGTQNDPEERNAHMNLLSTLYMLAQDEPKTAPEVDQGFQIFGDEGIIGTWQLLGIVVLIGLIIFYFIYKKKQQENS